MAAPAPYAVHANEFVTNSDDGLITIKANGRISVQGLCERRSAAGSVTLLSCTGA